MNTTKYLSTIVNRYQQEVRAGFENEFEAKRALWIACVAIFERAEQPDVWLAYLRKLSNGIIRPWHIESSIRSAERKAASHVAA